MNQFSAYKDQLKGRSKTWKVVNDFDYILNNIWCIYSFEKGNSKWRKIRSSIPKPFQDDINMEMYHVESGHGREQALMSVKTEMIKYIDFLLNDIES